MLRRRSAAAVVIRGLIGLCLMPMCVRHLAMAADATAPAAVVAATTAATAPTPSAAELNFFETRIRPVLVERCYECHSQGSEMVQGGLLVDSREGLLTGGDSGPAIVPGDAAGSLLLEALRYESFEMPPDGKLDDKVITDFEHWINAGAADPRTGGPAERRTIDLTEGRKFWCFQPIPSHAAPAVRKAEWPLKDIDPFILAKLEEANLEPAADAERAAWLRRVTFDLIGLPPSVEEIDAFLADESPHAHRRVVDRLLSSPHFGERWGRHWLDLARFAESSGGGRSLVFPDAWRYRDYVIESFNRDKPLDQFIEEQLAGDLMPHRSPAEERQQLIATGFLLLGAHNYEEQNKRALEMDVVDEQLDTIGRGLLGMTIACARCHDHKFDPIPTADYYALAGILRSTEVLVHANVSNWTTRPLPMDDAEEEAARKHGAEVKKLQKAIAAAKKRGGDDSEKKIAELKLALAAAKKQSPAPMAMAVAEAKAIEDCQICIRGSIAHRGPPIPRGMLQVALVREPPAIAADHSGRLELARWIASADNPLTTRVYVNRVWHHLFGAGLVRTVDNFGTTGETPSHPELLDDLASRFAADGWSTKRLVREIVLSRTYRMSSIGDEGAAAVDPENRLLAHMNRRRVDAESLRDAMLSAAGRLDLRVGGRNISDEVLAKSSPTTPAEYGYEFTDTRRSVYTPAFRNRMHELFEVFDFADQNRTVGARNLTTAAPQSLFMLNSAFAMEQARAAAADALEASEASTEERVVRAFREVLGRAPLPQELQIALAAVETGEPAESIDATAQLAAWERLFQGLFGCVDFRYLD
jgi:hypothetical protein